jgi:hypothetical protein
MDGNQKALALGFTLAICCLFAAPTIIAWQLGGDPDVQFWIGSEGRYAAFAPVFFLMTYFFHLHCIGQGAPPRRLFIFPILVPAMLFCMLGAYYVIHSGYLHDQLSASDCSGSGGFLREKKNLQAAYSQALGMYNTCVERLVNENGGNALPFQPTLQSCAEWELVNKAPEQTPKAYTEPKEEAEHLPWHAYPIGKDATTVVDDENESMKRLEHDPEVIAQWSYLADVEATHVCGGFCRGGPALWNHFDTLGRLGGPCANFIGHKFEIVRYHGLLILWTNLACVLVSAWMYHTSRKVLAELGYV